jgi:hypothetical protein
MEKRSEGPLFVMLGQLGFKIFEQRDFLDIFDKCQLTF